MKRLAGLLKADAALLFLVLWLVYGATITKYDLYDFTLQHAVVEALVERGTFQVGGSANPLLRDAGDKFEFEGKWLPAKQPGQFVAGAVVYAACRLFGITYAQNYLLAASLVTWLSASLLSALAGAFVFKLASEIWGFRRPAALFSALCYGLATNSLPYSGIAHHDVIAISYFILALYLIERAIQARPGERDHLGLPAGLLLGLTLFTSMLPAVVVVALIAYVMLTRRAALILRAFLGLLAGLLPLAVYNTHYFGNPLMQANMAGDYSDTIVSVDPVRFLDHLNVYFGVGDVSVLKYMPIVMVGLAGVCLFPRRLQRQQVLLASAAALHLMYVLNIPAIGYCQYGPRFLLPMTAVAMMGLAPWIEWLSSRRVAPVLAWGTSALAAYSFVVNLTGAIVGTMYCETRQFAFPVYLRMPLGPEMDTYPLALVCGTLLLFLGTLVLGRALLRR
ncbi:MAG TPA: glycosyltransferase family 39 protein [Candidatus Polarisedimenticolia bacterium]|nr:glycosyltransferase family 39 protein [Candidatus Polarisedimenticolia bacterium]